MLVIWVLALLSVVVLSWAQEWRTEIRLAANFREERQCRRLAEAGVYYALAKLVAAKAAEQKPMAFLGGTPPAPDPWNGDQRRHLLELPGGLAEVRVADEGGKINLNQAPGKVLATLFSALDISADKWRVMVESIEDWRQPGSQPRPFGAKSDYYLGLDPPYPAKNNPFDTVEELSWVRGFTDSTLPARLSKYLTVQGVSQQINLNTAPLEVLLSLGFPPELAQALIQEREVAPLQSQTVLPRLTANLQLQPLLQNLSFNSAPFFTILATGMINNKDGARHTIKVIVGLTQKEDLPWKFVYWAEDYPD